VLLDRDEIIEKRNQKVAIYLKYFGVVMAIFYIVLGTAFLFFPLIENTTPTIRYMVSVLLMLYGLFRFYRIVKK